MASVAVAAGFRGAALTRPPQDESLRRLNRAIAPSSPTPMPFCYVAVFVEGCCVLGLFPFIAAFLFELGETSLSIAGLVIAGFAVGGLFLHAERFAISAAARRRGNDDNRRNAGGIATRRRRLGSKRKVQTLSLIFDGLGLLHDPRLPAGVRQRIVGGSPRDGAVAAFVLLLHGPDRRPDRLWFRYPACRQGPDACLPRRPS